MTPLVWNVSLINSFCKNFKIGTQRPSGLCRSTPPQHASPAPSSCDLRCQVGILSVWCFPAGFVHPRHLLKFLTLRPPKAEGLCHNARSSAVGRFLTTSVISVTSPCSVPAHFATVFTFLLSSLFPFIPCEALHIVYADHSLSLSEQSGVTLPLRLFCVIPLLQL